MEAFIGSIMLFAGNFAPRGWAFCQGQIVAISSNTALFSLLGTTYGGDGRTTFALPDLRGRVPLGPGQGPGLSRYVEGQQGGQEAVPLTTQQIPSHTHVLVASGNTPTTAAPAGALLPTGSSRIYASDLGAPQQLAAQSVQPAGGSQPHDNVQPYLAINYIICLQGIFPSRN
jgi:microcystin-dependent protein